jgi:hypothetical protein
LEVPSQNCEIPLLATLSVRPAIRMEQRGSHWKDFHEKFYFGIFLKYFEKIEVSLTFGWGKGHFT